MISEDAVRHAVDVADTIPGWMERIELEWLASNAAGKTVVEIGTYCGRSAKALALGGATKIYCVDTFTVVHERNPGVVAWDGVNRHLKDEISSGQVVLVKGDSIAGVRHLLGNGVRADMVFIDAWHEYPSVVADIRGGISLLGGPGSGGLLSGHDFQPGVWDGVVRAVREHVRGYTTPALRIWAKVI